MERNTVQNVMEMSVHPLLEYCVLGIMIQELVRGQYKDAGFKLI